MVLRPVLALVLLVAGLAVTAAGSGAQEAAEPAATGLRVSAPPAQDVEPGAFVTLVFNVENASQAASEAVWEAVLPEGWSLLGDGQEPSMTLAAGASQALFLTVQVPAATAAGTYRVEVHLTGGEPSDPGSPDPQGAGGSAAVELRVASRREIHLQVPVEPRRVLPGNDARFTVNVVNLGNTPEEVQVTARADRSYPVQVEPAQRQVGPGETLPVRLRVPVPGDALPGTVVLTVAARTRAGLSAHERVSATVLPPPSGSQGDRPLHLEIPTVLRVGVGASGERVTSSGALVSGGSLPGDSHLSLLYSESDLSRPGQGGRGTGQLGQGPWQVRFGDLAAPENSLVRPSLTGASLGYEGSLLGLSLASGISGEETWVGSRLRIGSDRFNLSPSYFTTVRGDRAAGGYTLELRPWRWVGLEVGWAGSGAGAGPIPWPGVPPAPAAVQPATDPGDAFDWEPGRAPQREAERLRATLDLRPFQLSTRYERVGAAYLGLPPSDDPERPRLGDPGTEGYGVESRLRLGRVLTLTGAAEAYHVGAGGEMVPGEEGAPAADPRDVQRVELGSSWRLGPLPTLGLGVDVERSGPSGVFGDPEGGVAVSLSQEGFLSYRLGARASGALRPGEAVDLPERRYELQLRLGSNRSGVWSRYQRDQALDQVDPLEALKLGAGTTLWSDRLFASVEGGRAEREGRASRDTLRLDLGWRVAGDLSLGLILAQEAEAGAHGLTDQWGRTLFGDDAEQWVGLQLSTRFGLPVPWVKVRGRVVGRAFKDADGNGRPDQGEEGFPGLLLELGREQALTGEDGAFRFPSTEPGSYPFRIANLPSGWTVATSLPQLLPVAAGDESELLVPLVRAVTLEGAVFQDRDSDGARGPEEPGLAGMRVVLAGDGPSREAFTDPDGTFRFEDVAPGRYQVKLDPEWLPERAEATTPMEHALEVAPGSEPPEVRFGLVQQEKAIDFTYTEEGDGG
ncbi:SdrD B-like domain-containing protein [Limnochorda pilosa]|uniref:Alpha-galactosidase NEW3 domain-containing protein n=1 Tax=Limnochorda pilosa TaxID=1555112 RepID=A0A0K2SFY8_LIMPI|nr:SdrD B-like domain-containing protein [Limnochorda pilosa]BAS25952.1 hypothetical protein LIP_0095 [Limnochorda pilosa]